MANGWRGAQVTAGPRCVCPCSTRSPLLVTRLMTIKQGFRHYASVRSSLGGGRLHQTSQQCAAAPRCQGVSLTLSLCATFCPLVPPLLEHAGVEGRLPRRSRHFLRGGNAPDWIKSRRRMRVLPRSTPWREDIGCCVLWAAHEATLRVGKRKGKLLSPRGVGHQLSLPPCATLRLRSFSHPLLSSLHLTRN